MSRIVSAVVASHLVGEALELGTRSRLQLERTLLASSMRPTPSVWRPSASRTTSRWSSSGPSRR